MQCHEVTDVLVAYRDGEGTAGERAAVALHLLQCRACRDEERELGLVDALLDSWGDMEPASGFCERVMRQVAAEASVVVPLRPAASSWLRSAAVGRLAAAAAVLMLSFVLFAPQHASPPSGRAVLDEVVRGFDAGREVAVLDDMSGYVLPPTAPQNAADLHALLDSRPATPTDEVLDDLLNEQKDPHG